jgi:hypothetical protein
MNTPAKTGCGPVIRSLSGVDRPPAVTMSPTRGPGPGTGRDRHGRLRLVSGRAAKS